MSAQSEAVVRSLGLLFAEGTHCGLADGELLERFVSRGDGGAAHAFEGLVLRHGPMVFDVCRRVLGDPHDAEDAFQATFLVLAARARSIRRRKSVGCWLHGVALRVARRARADAARRRAHERRAAELSGRDVASGPPGDDSDFRALHEEVERLPRKYREPVVLCYLEGLPLEAAAGQLGCPVGTIGVRLMRAKQRLKDRLSRRGVSRADGLLIAGPGPSALPASLVHSTVGAASRLAAGGAGPLVSTLADGVLRSMATVRLAQVVVISAAVILGAASAGGALGLAAPQLAEGPAGRAPESWIGKKAVIKFSAPLMEWDRVVGDNIFRVYTVDRVEGDRVKLVSEEVGGWIKAEDVVLLDQAIDFYTEVIRGNAHHLGARVRRAQVREYLGERAAAIDELTEAIRIGPPDAAVYGVRGDMFKSDEEFDKAIADFTEAIRLTPSATGYFLRGQCWAAEDEFDKAIADYDESIRLDPTSGLSYLNRGLALAHKEDYDRAIADFSEAIKLGLEHTGAAYRCRGIARLDKSLSGEGNESPEAAIADLTEAIRLDPKDADAYYQRGRAWTHWAGREHQAITDLDEAIRLNPSHAAAYRERGGEWADKKEYEKAIADLNRAIQIDPRDANAYLNRGWTWLDRGEFDKAMADLTQSIRLDPEEPAPYNHRAEALARKGEYDRAISDYGEVIRLDPNDQTAFSGRGTAWFFKHEYDRAIADFDQSIRVFSEEPRARLYRGLARLQKEDYDGAITDFDVIIRLDPDRVSGVDPKGVYARLNRGWARFKKRDYARAVADYEEANRIDPKNPDVADARAWLWATCPDARFRDGKRAVELAEDLCKSYEWKVPHYVATLAAACAEAGDFDAAVKWQVKANEIEPDEAAKAEGEARLELFRAKRPYHDDRP